MGSRKSPPTKTDAPMNTAHLKIGSSLKFQLVTFGPLPYLPPLSPSPRSGQYRKTNSPVRLDATLSNSPPSP